ncbi:putative bromodomain-containing protein 10 [Aptenodytes patagonicus]|uniref:putative bromodomain-containing protein 10 n=1 Tax=Aptenodytes patagonicus TaxID=9234 RepID=UPI003F9F394C
MGAVGKLPPVAPDGAVSKDPALASGPPEREEDHQQDEDNDDDVGGKNSSCTWEQNLSPELQQGYRILCEFLLEKHRPLTTPFLKPLADQASIRDERGGASQSGYGNSCSFQQSSAGMWLLKMEEKFSSGQYTGITDFVADFRLMLEMCYRLHGVDHWLSKQAQKLEVMLEQKLALLSRRLRAKTTIAVTSRGCYGLEDEMGRACTSTRRRSTPRTLVGLTTGVFESIMVQVLRQEEQLRAKEEKRLREQERKEGEAASRKEIEEWEKSLLAQAAPTRMETMWEIPAIGHFLCLAQQILNLPEIVFYELERCLLMPQCNAFLSKIMTSLLSPPHRRSTLHQKPILPYGTWEAALRQKVQQWYTVVGQTDNPNGCAEKLGLCPQFFEVLGEVNPLEEKPFHELPFYQKVWLLKGLCDFVYETQKDVQDAVLGQPIHECREVILGYDYLENAYVHFPQFCGADVRIYRQKPLQAPEFPTHAIKVKKVTQIKLEKIKCDPVNKSNEEVASDGREEPLPCANTEPGKNVNYSVCCPGKKNHLDSFSDTSEKIKPNCEIKSQRVNDIKKPGCYKESLVKAISSGEIVGFGELLSTGEIRVVENGENRDKTCIVKTEPSLSKENILKTCQIHVNDSHNDNPDMTCHKIAKETVLENSLQNNKKLKLTKMLAKKKKKKKKKLKDALNENLQRKLDDLQKKHEIHPHPFKSYKPEKQNKLFIIKKTVKHEHKSGKKSISKKAIKKKRKAVAKSTVPEFQLICTNLDELRELITKIENELTHLEDMKKKSGRWYHRKQAVKELHSTLIRLLNELLPWELKLMKAFQRNRSRLKKDYDNFQRQPDHDKFTRELWSNDKSEGDAGKEPFEIVTSKSSESVEHEDVSKKDHLDFDEMKLLEMVLPTGKNRLLKRDWTSKEIHKTLPKSVKRQSEQNSCLDDSTNELSPRKQAKLSTTEAIVQSSESGMQTDSCLTELKKYEQPTPESFFLSDPATSISNFLKRTKPIQALLAKSTGNKVTLTNRLPPPPGTNVSTSEKTVISPMESLLIKPALPCQTSSKSPLQTAYKMPGSHYVSKDLHNSSIKIQMQAVIDSKTGEKVMQPKNFLIQQNEGKIISKNIQSWQQKSPELHCTTFSQAAIVNVSLTPVLVTPTAHATNTLPSTIFNKHIMHLSQITSPVNRLQSLPSINSTSNLLSSTITMSHSETDKTKPTVSAAPFPISLALPTVSTGSQPFTSATTLSGSTNTTSSFHSLTSQKTSDSFEAKQELKTVYIRESQAILVTTQGGNTGIVKVQTNPDQTAANSLSPNSAFAYAPQLKAFLVPKSTTLSTSTLSSITTATSDFPGFGQASVSVFATSAAASFNIPSFPAGLNQIMGKNSKCMLGQLPHGGILNQTEKTCHVSSPTFLAPLSSTGTLMSAIPSSPVNAISVGQDNTGITPNSSIQQQGDTKAKKHPLIQSEISTATNGDVISGTPIQKVMLVKNPPILSPCGATGVNIIPSLTSTGVSAQKLVFINTPLPSGASNTNLVVESSKQILPSSLNKTFISATEQPQLVLLPSTVEVPIKKKSSPNVAQVKDVKIGLNIGHAFVNTKGNEQQTPINILQSVNSKGEDKKSMGLTLCLSSSGSLVPVCSGFTSQNVTSLNKSIGVVMKAATAFTVTAANACLESVSVTPSETSVGTQPTVLIDGNNTSRIRPGLAKQLCTLNIRNTVNISTVETRHLASPVLVSTTRPTVSPQNLSTLQFPAVSLPGSVAISPKVIHTVPHLIAVPNLPSLPKDQPPALLQFQLPGISAALPSNANKPQTILSSASRNTGKVINFPSFSSLQCQQMSPNIVKESHTYTCASAIQMSTASPSVTSQAGDQLNEPSIQQKIIINTSMPLSPGTEIMINGTHFIVPSQGLGPGSHVLLSSNTKQTPLPLAINHGQGAQGVPIVNPVPLKITLAPTNSLNWQTSKHPLKSSTKIVNSSGSANALPTVHTVPQILNTSASSCASLSTTTLSMSSVIKPPANLLVATSLISAMHPGNSQLSSNTSVFALDTSIKKLLVSPEGAILNAINTSASKASSLPSVVMSTSRNPITVFPPFQSSCLDKPEKAAY